MAPESDRIDEHYMRLWVDLGFRELAAYLAGDVVAAAPQPEVVVEADDDR